MTFSIHENHGRAAGSLEMAGFSKFGQDFLPKKSNKDLSRCCLRKMMRRTHFPKTLPATNIFPGKPMVGRWIFLLGCPNFKKILLTLLKTKSHSTWHEVGHSEPTPVFQVRFVSFREGTQPFMGSWKFTLLPRTLSDIPQQKVAQRLSPLIFPTSRERWDMFPRFLEGKLKNFLQSWEFEGTPPKCHPPRNNTLLRDY